MAASRPLLPLLALAALLAAPLGQAAGVAHLPPVADLSAAAAHATDVLASGPLVAFSFLDEGQGHPQAGGMAQRVDIRVESQTVQGRVDGNLGNPNPQPPKRETHFQAHLDSTWADQQHEAYAFPLPGSPPPQLSLTGCLGVQPSAGDRAVVVPHFATPSQPLPSVETAGAQRLTSCSPPHLQVQGDFLLVLWGTELRVEDANGTSTLWSGNRPDPAAPGAPPYVENDQVQELFLEVHGGSIALTWGDPSSAGLYAAGLQLSSAALTLSEATGTLWDTGRPRQVQAHTLALGGALNATFGPAQGGVLPIGVRGTPSSAILDGHPLAWVVAAQPRPFAWSVIFLMVAAVVVPAAGVAWRRAWARRTLGELEDLLAARRPGAVVRRSRALVRSPFRTEALVLRIDAFLRQGQPGPALAALQEMPAAVQAGPLGQFLHGHILATAGDAQAGAPYLARAAQGPEFRARIEADALYAQARREPSLQAALETGGRA